MKEHTKSCGCISLEYKEREKAYRMRKSFNGMHARCNGEDQNHYKYYKQKGIVVCERWQQFKNFYEDMQETWSIGMQLDRIENDKGYYVGNCRRVTPTEQQRNKTNIKLTQQKVLEIRLSTLSNSELAKVFNVNQSTISRVLNNKRWQIA